MVSPHGGEGGPGGTLGRVPGVMCPAGGAREGCRCSLPPGSVRGTVTAVIDLCVSAPGEAEQGPEDGG